MLKISYVPGISVFSSRFLKNPTSEVDSLMVIMLSSAATSVIITWSKFLVTAGDGHQYSLSSSIFGTHIFILSLLWFSTTFTPISVFFLSFCLFLVATLCLALIPSAFSLIFFSLSWRKRSSGSPVKMFSRGLRRNECIDARPLGRPTFPLPRGRPTFPVPLPLPRPRSRGSACPLPRPLPRPLPLITTRRDGGPLPSFDDTEGRLRGGRPGPLPLGLRRYDRRMGVNTGGDGESDRFNPGVSKILFDSSSSMSWFLSERDRKSVV